MLAVGHYSSTSSFIHSPLGRMIVSISPVIVKFGDIPNHRFKQSYHRIRGDNLVDKLGEEKSHPCEPINEQ